MIDTCNEGIRESKSGFCHRQWGKWEHWCLHVFFSVTDKLQTSQQKENSSDCEIYMIYNADCLTSHQDTLKKQIDSVQLRYHYLECLLELKSQERSEQQIVDMILPSDKTIRIKWRCVSDDISDDELNENQQGFKKSHMMNWEASSHLSSQAAWIKEQNHLTAINSKHRYEKETVLNCWKWAEDLLQIIEMIRCEEVMMTWKEAINQMKSHSKSRTLKTDSTAKVICQLIERIEVRFFKGKVLWGWG